MVNRGCPEPSLDELFGDDAMRLLMQRDGVTESDIRALLCTLKDARAVALAQLRRFKHFLGSKYLRSLESTPEGRHYSGIGDAGAPAVIFGDGWAGSSSLSFFSNRLSSGSGSV